MDFMFSDEQIENLSHDAKISLIKMGSKLDVSNLYSYHYTVKTFLIVFYRMNKALTKNGIMQMRPREQWDEEVSRYKYDFDFAHPRSDSEGYNALVGFLIPKFIDSGLLIEVSDGRYKRYIVTPHLRELIRLWLPDDVYILLEENMENTSSP